MATLQNFTLPKKFDTRFRWLECSSVHKVVNQGGCGSCWVSFHCIFFLNFLILNKKLVGIYIYVNIVLNKDKFLNKRFCYAFKRIYLF